MPLDRTRCQPLLQNFEFRRLFIEELGWDKHTAGLEVPLKTGSAQLEAIAHKRGFVAWHCLPDSAGRLPDSAARRKIEREVTKSSYEHFIVFTDSAKTRQIWQWVRREQGRPLRVREFELTQGQSGAAILQKLDPLFVSLDEEETITLPEVAGRARANVNERVTKKFYEEFRNQHTAFLKFITGIPNQGDHEWYASVMLNRLMFVYFVQRKGFLDGDTDYLRNRLNQLKAKSKGDKFYSFYRYFLLKLFHQGLGAKGRKPELEILIGRVPYLNGGIFDVHQLESDYGDAIQIPDTAFEAIFDYFDRYQWHLDERPLCADNEINPDVLGYIFEKYINQKQMGAYYTKEDITEYISKSTIIPFLFDAARAKCKVAFENPDGPTVWDFLRENPDSYIYPAVRHGTDKELPPDIAAGLDANQPNLIERRQPWNKPAPADYALPTEIWREVVARRQRYEEVRQKLAAGEVREVNDFITLNLDLRQFAQDVIQNCEGPDLLMAFWNAISTITVLDPTGGSGAFIFAALNILEPLYEACLDRMEAFIAEARAAHGVAWKPHPKSHLAEFERLLARIEQLLRPNATEKQRESRRKYFIYKHIIINNLYAVDIMEEAVEICKLRLFLKLAAQVEPDAASENLGIEPLPDIDFNILAGNTLIGCATESEARLLFTEEKSGQGKLMLGDSLDAYKRFEDKLLIANAAVRSFRLQQEELGGAVTAQDKEALRTKLKALEDELNRHLAGEYGVKVDADSIRNPESPFNKWVKSHQPLHWFIEFYGILNGGGFDVIIGNPPYLEIREVDYGLKNYACLDSGAIHAMCMERSERLLHKSGYMSMIVPLSLPSTQRMQVVQELLESGRNAWFANYAWRPAKLFDTVNRALTIFVVSPSDDGHTYSTNYQKWTSDDRDGLMDRLNYVEVLRKRPACWIPKVGDSLEQHILKKCLAVKTAVKNFVTKSEHRVYYRTTGGLYWKVFTDFAPAFNLNGKQGHSSRETWFTLGKKEHVRSVIAALSSDVFWWWYTVTSNVRDLNPFDIQNFPLPESAFADPTVQSLGTRYLKDLEKNSTMLVREQKQTGTTETQSFKIQKSKPIIDEIDTVLAGHYGFTAEELDFILNYDIKYRLGRSTEEDE